MLIVLTDEQELAMRRASYQHLAPGVLFDLSGKRHFIAIEKTGDCVEVIELDPENIKRIVRGERCTHSKLRFDEMGCLHVCSSNNE